MLRSGRRANVAVRVRARAYAHVHACVHESACEFVGVPERILQVD